MRAIACGAALLLGSCAPIGPSVKVGLLAASPVALPEQAARRGLAAQIAAWNRGDLETALGSYWNSPEMTWVSRSGVERGFAAFAQGMRGDFADRSAMGTYSAEVLDARDIGTDALIVFRWQIVKDGKRLMGGVSTQVWRQVDGAWRAVLEHAS